MRDILHKERRGFAEGLAGHGSSSLDEDKQLAPEKDSRKLGNAHGPLPGDRFNAKLDQVFHCQCLQAEQA